MFISGISISLCVLGGLSPFSQQRKRNTSPTPLPARRAFGGLSSVVFRLWDLFIPRNRVGAYPLLANAFISLGAYPREVMEDFSVQTQLGAASIGCDVCYWKIAK